MDPETAALLEESERLLRGDAQQQQQQQQQQQRRRQRHVQVSSKPAQKPRRKMKRLRAPKFGARLERNSEAEIQRDMRELKEEEQATVQVVESETPAKRPESSTQPSTLVNREWENSLARSILTIYHANAPGAHEEEVQRSGKLPALSKRLRRRRRRRPPGPIWFDGDGAVRAVWCSLSEEGAGPDPRQRRHSNKLCVHELCCQLRDLEARGRFEKYVEAAHRSLLDFSRQQTLFRAEAKQQQRRRLEDLREMAKQPTREPPSSPAAVHAEGAAEQDAHTCGEGAGSRAVFDELAAAELAALEEHYQVDWETIDPSLLLDGGVLRVLWRQLVVCCCIFASKLVEQQRFGPALALLKLGEQLLEDPASFMGGTTIRTQLRAFVHSALSFYYYRRHKANAAAVYAERALRFHVKLGQWTHVARCHVHCAVVLSMMGKHEEAIKCLAQVLDMVEDERLQGGGTNAHKVCLVAVAYHNIAVEQLLVRRPAEACVSSQNARRLARLSLSYANRWINQFERTHHFALAQLQDQHYGVGERAANAAAEAVKRKGAAHPPAAVRESLKSKRAQRLYRDIADSLEPT